MLKSVSAPESSLSLEVRCSRWTVPLTWLQTIHVGGVRHQKRSRRRLEEAVAGPECVGTDEVEQLGARLPARIGVYGH